MSFTRTECCFISSSGPERAEAKSNELASKLWFKTPPLEKSFLERVSRIQLQTTAHDQGYASFPDQGSWSWFDVAILESPESNAPLVRDGLTCLWRSHSNIIGFGQDTTTAGEIFDKEDDLFRVLQPGDVLAVIVCARFLGWENNASSGYLEFRLEKTGHELPAFDAAQFEEKRRMNELKKQIELLLTGYLDDRTEKGEKPAYSLVREMMLPGEAIRGDLARQRDGAPLRLLSIDGGGVRGISSLVILENIMLKLTDNPDTKPCDYFDMICGTSTGGLIALMLGRLRMSIPQCIAAYNKFASEIFEWNGDKATGAKRLASGYAYGADTFESAIKAIVKQYSPGDETMISKSAGHYCKVFVVAGEASNLSKTPEHLRTYKSAKFTNIDKFLDIPIWQAARATSAAPTFLPSITINGTELVDGGLLYNNPVALLLGEAYHEFGVERLMNTRCLLTLGTGHGPNLHLPPQPGIFGSGKYLLGVIDTMSSIATDCENTHEKARKVFPEDDTYWRFNYGIKNGGDWEKVLRLDNWQGMESFAKGTRGYISSPEQTPRAQGCASKLETVS
ncbi:FabD/lysophospholipase-like protein [Pleurotus eryngii]|uniref:FabD/lysophospholipase-like protein n=1 Tax=Pleurotus eryngii TaxID=5323 RepID=A0A9P5ZH72_PLEER|nr:FabD/lysophospholipase-like protein [Pleurotus eryngii]